MKNGSVWNCFLWRKSSKHDAGSAKTLVQAH
jgi:hypothetical protein